MKGKITWEDIEKIGEVDPIVSHVLRSTWGREDQLKIMVFYLHDALVRAREDLIAHKSREQIKLCSWAPAHAGECDLVGALSKENRELRERVCKMECYQEKGMYSDRDGCDWCDEESATAITAVHRIIDPDNEIEV